MWILSKLKQVAGGYLDAGLCLRTKPSLASLLTDWAHCSIATACCLTYSIEPLQGQRGYQGLGAGSVVGEGSAGRNRRLKRCDLPPLGGQASGHEEGEHSDQETQTQDTQEQELHR